MLDRIGEIINFLKKYVSMPHERETQTRRTVLKTAAAGTALAAAGCLGDGDDGAPDVSPDEVEDASANLEGGLNVWNWYSDFREYTVEQFLEEHDLDVAQSAYSSPGEWFSSLEAGEGEIDVVGSTPDWTVRSRENEYLSPLPLDAMTFWDDTPEFIKDVLEEYHMVDGELYAAPQAVQLNPTLTYNNEFFDSPPDSWGILWDDDLEDQVFMWDRSYYACQIAAMYLGQDPFDPDDYEEIEEALIQQRDLNVNLWEDFNQARQQYLSEDVVVGPFLDGQSFQARFFDDAPVDFTVPEEGAFWVLNDFVIPADAPHPNAAVAYTDFVADPEVNKMMLPTMGYRGAYNDEMMEDVYAEELESGDITEEMLDFHRWDEFEDRLIFEEPLDEDVLERYDEIWGEVRVA